MLRAQDPSQDPPAVGEPDTTSQPPAPTTPGPDDAEDDGEEDDTEC